MAYLTVALTVLGLSAIFGMLDGDNSIFSVIDFGALEYFDSSNPIFSRSTPIELIQEDVNNPNTIIFATKYGLKRYSLTTGISILCGNETEKGYEDGPALIARFGEIKDFIQFNNTHIAILDFSNGCIRHYDHVTGTVSTLIGSCAMGNKKKLHGGTAEITADDLLYPVALVYMKSSNQFLVTSLNYNVYKVDMRSGAMERLKINLVNVTFMLLNTDETLLYASHPCGVSSVNLKTLGVEILADSSCYVPEQSNHTGKEADARAVNFPEASFRWLSKPVWVIPDYAFIVISAWKQVSMVIVDLEKRYVHHLCNGSQGLNKTIIGPPSECKINSPVSVFISNDTAYIATSEERNRYNNTAHGSLYKMKLNIARCPSGRTNDFGIHYPIRKQYDIYSSMTVSCPDGYGLNSSYSTVTCVHSTAAKSKPAQWDNPIPSCSDHLFINSITPNSGQKEGGILVTATGVLPKEDLIQIYTYQPQALAVNFTKKENMAIFVMPPSSQPCSQKITVGFTLTNSLNVSRHFNFSYSIINNPYPYLIDIKSGGLYGVFSVDSVPSANVYTIRDHNDSSIKNCTMEDSCLLCKLPGCMNAADTCVVLIGADGVAITGGQVTILPDPVINYINTELPISREEHADVVLTLTGKYLNLGYGNRFYHVLLQSSPVSTVNCVPIVEQITSTSLPCIISRTLVSTDRNYTIKVHIGNLDVEVGRVMFIQSFNKSQILDDEENSKDIIAYSVSTPAVIVVAVVVLIVFLRRRKQSMLSEGTKFEMRLIINDELLAEVKQMEIPRAKLTVSHDRQVGQGHFGVIYMGILQCNMSSFRVAIKTVKAIAITGARVEEFLKEALLSRKFHHINVLPVIGVCWSEECIPQVVLPYMTNGDLKSVLKDHSLLLTFGDLLHFARQVACGMEYLSKNNFVHRDIAARNCLVSENYIVKISDFGLSKDLCDRDYYRLREDGSKELPVKWMSVESLQSGLFSTSSDVWSFGVLLWEICTRGSDPYLNLDPRVMLSYLQAGNRLPQPSYSPDAIYELMKRCWKEVMTERPSFTFIHEFLRQLLEGSTLDPVSVYSYVREYTKDIPDDYFYGNYQDGNYEKINIGKVNAKPDPFPPLTSCFKLGG